MERRLALTMSPAQTNIAHGSDNAAELVVPAEPNVADESAAGAEPTAGARRKRGEELESAIRQATVDELTTCGYGELSIESVAARAQTGKASIYRRWPTKVDLVTDALVGLCTGPLHFASEVGTDDSITTREALRQVMLRIVGLMTGPSSPAMRACWAEVMRDSVFAQTIQREFFGPRRDTMNALLERGIARGEVRPDIRTDLVHDVIGGTLCQRVLMRGVTPSEDDIDAFLDQFLMPAIEPHKTVG